MKLISLQAQNFGSYKDLKLDFTGKGLTLISGPTGAGKSTIMDSVSWALFGKTAKNGTADEVVKWGSAETTKATIELENVTVTRTRNPNDLYYTAHPTRAIMRGKDLKDTQLKLNQLLGITPETFLAAVYMHEFSLTSEFFQTNAKNRRQIMEQLTDLSLATNLQANTSEYTKMLKQDLDKLTLDVNLASALVFEIQSNLDKQKAKYIAWQKSWDAEVKQLEFQSKNFDLLKLESISELKQKSEAFEEDRARRIKTEELNIEDLDKLIHQVHEANLDMQKLLDNRPASPATKCPTCGNVKNVDAALSLQKQKHEIQLNESRIGQMVGKINTHSERRKRIQNEVNPYAAQIANKELEPNEASSKYLAKLTETNPYSFEDLKEQLAIKQGALNDALRNKGSVQNDLSTVKLLQEAVQEFRGRIISNTVVYLQNKTNKFLETHFESEFRVSFTIAEADSLDIEIQKDGILCSYTQLSKGQRQMLKLCFGASVQLAVANHSGVRFNTIFMDEVLTGLDETNKAKAFGLIQELTSEYENIYIIEHNENFKTLFTSRIDVSLENGNSVIYEQN